MFNSKKLNIKRFILKLIWTDWLISRALALKFLSLRYSLKISLFNLLSFSWNFSCLKWKNKKVIKKEKILNLLKKETVRFSKERKNEKFVSIRILWMILSCSLSFIYHHELERGCYRKNQFCKSHYQFWRKNSALIHRVAWLSADSSLQCEFEIC